MNLRMIRLWPSALVIDVRMDGPHKLKQLRLHGRMPQHAPVIKVGTGRQLRCSPSGLRRCFGLTQWTENFHCRFDRMLSRQRNK